MPAGPVSDASPAPALVVLAAGAARRFGGLKQLAAVGPGGQSLLDYALFDAARAGFAEGVVVVAPGHEHAFRRHFSQQATPPLPVRYVVQDPAQLPAGAKLPARDKPWGTGHALYCALGALARPCVAINADDFYGLDPLLAAAGWLRSTPPCEAAACTVAMVGYRLDETLWAGGGVSRAICEVDASGNVLDLEELLEVSRGPAGITGCSSSDGAPRQLTGSETVSMNLWAFPAGAAGLFGDELSRFVAHHGNDPAAEFMIGPAVAAALRRSRARVRVLRAPGECFGLTFAHDLPRVRAAIAGLIERGRYPRDLASGAGAGQGPTT